MPQGSWLKAHASSLRVKVFNFQSCKVSFRLSDKALAADGFLLVFYKIAFVGQHLSVSISLSISTALLQSMLWLM